MRSRRSVWQAIALGALSLCACGHAPKVDSDDLLPPTHEAQVWLQGRLDALVAAAPKVKLDGDKPLPGQVHLAQLRLHVINESRPRAFADNQNRIYVSTGLLMERANSCDEVMGVLAHELGHLLLNHPHQQYEPVKQAQGAVEAAVKSLEASEQYDPSKPPSSAEKHALTTIFAVLIGVGQPTFGSRLDEANTDRLAVRLLRAAGVEPEPYAEFLDRNAMEVGACPDPFYATHPPTPERAKAVRVLAKTLGPASPAKKAAPVRQVKKGNTVRRKKKGNTVRRGAEGPDTVRQEVAAPDPTPPPDAVEASDDAACGAKERTDFDGIMRRLRFGDDGGGGA